MKRAPLNVFFSYAHEDEAARDQLDEHLELLARRNLIVRWHDRHIVPGLEWNDAIQGALDSADIILLLISEAFMGSGYVRDHEIPAAMAEHETGRARVVPVLLEDVADWEKAPFARLELLPTKARAVSKWSDPVDAFADVARGVARVVRDVIVAGGGPFEFGAHEFTDAELSGLPSKSRERCRDGLTRLRTTLNDTIPPRRYEQNLLVANWSLRKFGGLSPTRLLDETTFYVAEVISAFDVVALQEVHRDLGRLEALLEILGPDWTYLVTEVAPGVAGNAERFAILHYTPRTEFRHFSSNVILPGQRDDQGVRTAEQLARPPLLAAFRAGGWEFEVCTTHIIFGRGGVGAFAERRREVESLVRYLRFRAKTGEAKELLLMGDFQLERPGSPVHELLVGNGVQLPEAVLQPDGIRGRHWSIIGFLSDQREMPLGNSNPPAGVVNVFDDVLRDEDFARYSRTAEYRSSSRRRRAAESIDDRGRNYRQWRTYQLSDHLPIWVELEPSPPSPR